MRKTFSCVGCFCVAVSLSLAPAQGADFQRGARLHDDACTGCHGASMYSRPQQERNPYFTVRKQVEIWSDFVGMKWSDRDINDVAYYVQKRFYEKSCPNGPCE